MFGNIIEINASGTVAVINGTNFNCLLRYCYNIRRTHSYSRDAPSLSGLGVEDVYSTMRADQDSVVGVLVINLLSNNLGQEMLKGIFSAFERMQQTDQVDKRFIDRPGALIIAKRMWSKKIMDGKKQMDLQEATAKLDRRILCQGSLACDLDP